MAEENLNMTEPTPEEQPSMAEGVMDPAQVMMQGAMAQELGSGITNTGNSTEEEKEGRGDDTILGHLTPGEIVIPVDLQNNTNMENLAAMFEDAVVDLENYTVGHEANKINPDTGYPEFGAWYNPVTWVEEAGSTLASGMDNISGKAQKEKAEKAAEDLAAKVAEENRLRIQAMIDDFNTKMAAAKIELAQEAKDTTERLQAESLLATKEFNGKMGQLKKQDALNLGTAGAVTGDRALPTGPGGRAPGGVRRRKRKRSRRIVSSERRPL